MDGMENGIRQPMFKGTVRQFSPKPQAPYDIDEAIPIGATGKYYTKFSLRARAATYPYLKTAIQLHISNGAGTVFGTVSMLELFTIKQFIDSFIEKFNAKGEYFARREEEATKTAEFQALINSQGGEEALPDIGQLQQMIKAMQAQQKLPEVKP